MKERTGLDWIEGMECRGASGGRKGREGFNSVRMEGGWSSEQGEDGRRGQEEGAKK
jgi:hypothetical protein